MEYIIGFLSALVFVFLFIQIQYRYDILNETLRFVRSSQSTRHAFFGQSLNAGFNKNKNIDRQSNRHDKNVNIKVIIMDDQAYWIKDNIFYMADMLHGNVDKETTRKVDTMTMDRIQLDKMIFIIDRLREEAFDDRRGTGY
jgi:hypothetical protein